MSVLENGSVIIVITKFKTSKNIAMVNIPSINVS